MSSRFVCRKIPHLPLIWMFNIADFRKVMSYSLPSHANTSVSYISWRYFSQSSTEAFLTCWTAFYSDYALSSCNSGFINWNWSRCLRGNDSTRAWSSRASTKNFSHTNIHRRAHQRRNWAVDKGTRLRSLQKEPSSKFLKECTRINSALGCG